MTRRIVLTTGCAVVALTDLSLAIASGVYEFYAEGIAITKE
jgi:hypothetical protein